MKLFLLICLTAFAISTQASKVIWGVDFSSPTSSMEVANFTGGSAYSYVLSGSSALNGFLNSWSLTSELDKSYGGLSQSNLTVTQLKGEALLGTSSSLTVGEGSNQYFVVIMVDANGNYYYNTSTTATVVSDQASSDPSTNTNFTDAGWTQFTPGAVPEPTVLALLALGIAGVVLKRKVA